MVRRHQLHWYTLENSNSGGTTSAIDPSSGTSRPPTPLLRSSLATADGLRRVRKSWTPATVTSAETVSSATIPAFSWGMQKYPSVPSTSKVCSYVSPPAMSINVDEVNPNHVSSLFEGRKRRSSALGARLTACWPDHPHGSSKGFVPTLLTLDVPVHVDMLTTVYSE